MSKGLDQYLERYGSDAEFRARVESDFDDAVAEFGLDENEKQELREYLQSDRHRAIEGTATRAFEEMVSGLTGQPSAEEMKLIEERERRNLAAMLGQSDDTQLPAGVAREIEAETTSAADRISTQFTLRLSRVELAPGWGLMDCVEAIHRASATKAWVIKNNPLNGDAIAKEKLETLRSQLRMDGPEFYDHLVRIVKDKELKEAVQNQVQKSMEAIEAGPTFVGP